MCNVHAFRDVYKAVKLPADEHGEMSQPARRISMSAWERARYQSALFGAAAMTADNLIESADVILCGLCVTVV